MNSWSSQCLKVLIDGAQPVWLEVSSTVPPGSVFDHLRIYGVIIIIFHYPKHGGGVITEYDKVSVQRKFWQIKIMNHSNNKKKEMLQQC